MKLKTDHGKESFGRPKSEQWKQNSGKYERPKRDLKDIECFNCHEHGHYSSNCPHNAMFCTERRFDGTGQSSLMKKQAVVRPGVVKQGTVEGKAVSNILLDTGCSRTLVHQDLVPRAKFKEGEVVAIRCAHGDTVLYPLAEISLDIGGRLITVEAAVSDTLPMAVLLGTDTPELPELLIVTQIRQQKMLWLSPPGHKQGRRNLNRCARRRRSVESSHTLWELLS